jgi:hypothetical protein
MVVLVVMMMGGTGGVQGGIHALSDKDRHLRVVWDGAEWGLLYKGRGNGHLLEGGGVGRCDSMV